MNKPKVNNIPRHYAKNFPHVPDNAVWISICEPHQPDTCIQSKYLDQLPKLSISFWDLTRSVPSIYGDEGYLHPPTENDAKQIVDFLLTHRDKHVIVNCAAGISRSGAVAQFCEARLGYEWLEEGVRRARPNHLLYRMMDEYFLSLSYEERFGAKPLLTSYEKTLDKIAESDT